jgi:hypothetical protein
MSANGGSKVVVLYTIVNSESDSCDSLFNAFTMNVSGPKGLTLASVKQYVYFCCSFSYFVEFSV